MADGSPLTLAGKTPAGQPVGRQVIDWSSPLARGLRALVDGRVNRELVLNQRSHSGFVSPKVGPRNDGIVGTDRTSGQQRYYTHPDLDSVSAYTVLVYADIDSYSSSVFGGTYYKTANIGSNIGFGNFELATLIVEHSGGIFNSGFGDSELNGLHAHMVRYDGTNAYVNVDGLDTQASGSIGAIGTGRGELVIMANRSGALVAGWHYMTAVWNRCLSDAEAAEVLANPYALFRDDRPALPVAAIAPTYSLTPSDIDADTEVGAASPSLNYAISPGDLDAATEVGGAALSVAFAVTPGDVDAASEVGAAALSVGFAMSPGDIDAATEVGAATLAIGVPPPSQDIGDGPNRAAFAASMNRAAFAASRNSATFATSKNRP